MKPGYKTSEFWVVVIMAFLGIGVEVGFFTSEQVQELVKAANDLVAAVTVFAGAVGPIAAVVVVAWKYISGRVALKRAALQK